jgi:hypothetical protein
MFKINKGRPASDDFTDSSTNGTGATTVPNWLSFETFRIGSSKAIQRMFSFTPVSFSVFPVVFSA